MKLTGGFMDMFTETYLQVDLFSDGFVRDYTIWDLHD